MNRFRAKAGPPDATSERSAHLGVLVALAMLTPLSINLYLPALPSIGEGFDVAVPRLQLSLGLFLLGLGLGQGLGAPLSDQYGRRPAVLLGAAAFCVATIGILACRSAEQFMALRLAQGIAAGVATVNFGAVVGDLFNTQGAARAIGAIFAVQAVARLAAPAIGAFLLAAFGWRSIFLALLAYCVLLAYLIWLKLPETVSARALEQDGSVVGRAIARYRRVLGLRRALAHAVCLAFSSACMLVYLTDSAFIYMTRFGLGPQTFSGLLALNVIAFALVTIFNARLLKRYPAGRIAAAGCCIQFLAASAFLAHTTLTTPSLEVIIPIFMVLSGSQGMILGNAGACFLSHFADSRATASGVAGSLSFLVGGALGAGLGIFHTGTLATAGTLVALCALLALLPIPFARPAEEPASPGYGSSGPA